MKSRVEMQQFLISEVQKQFEAQKISVVELAEILFMISKADDSEEFVLILDLFKDKFDVFFAILDSLKIEDQETFEELITKIIPLIIKDDPLLASQVSSRATQSGVTMESLVNEFPNIKKYLN